jgi:hypothetical protein
MCNRDEQRTRPAAIEPKGVDAGALQALLPIDPQSGGTWIGVNSAGLASALLNRTPSSPAHRGDAPRSRGAIIPPLLAHARLGDAIDDALSLDVQAFAPFTLVIVQGWFVAAITSNGRALATDCDSLREPRLWTSSSLGDDVVVGPRRALFERVLDGSRGTWSRGQRWFHDHQWPERREISVMMSRPDARTVSRTTVELSPWSVALHYEALRTRAESDEHLVPSGSGQASGNDTINDMINDAINDMINDVINDTIWTDRAGDHTAIDSDSTSVEVVRAAAGRIRDLTRQHRHAAPGAA